MSMSWSWEKRCICRKLMLCGNWCFGVREQYLNHGGYFLFKHDVPGGWFDFEMY